MVRSELWNVKKTIILILKDNLYKAIIFTFFELIIYIFFIFQEQQVSKNVLEKIVDEFLDDLIIV